MAESCSCATWARTDTRLTNHHPRCPEFKQKRFVKVTLHHGGTYTQDADDLGVLLEEISEADIGAIWTVELVAMTQEEYDRLPEFAGH